MLALLLNVLWILFGGLWMAVGWAIEATLRQPGPHAGHELPYSAAADAAAPGHAAFTNLMASGMNGAATIIGNSRQHLGNLECWGVGGLWSGGAWWLSLTPLVHIDR